MIHLSRKKSFLFAIIFLLILLSSVFLLHQCSISPNARFESYCEELFRQEVSSNAITLHYTLKDPSVFQIHDTPLSLGQVSTNVSAMGSAAENALAKLHSFDASDLSDENRLIYDLLEDSFSSACEMAPFALYEEPLAPLTGTQSQLPILLSEYPFYSVKDVHSYLSLLAELPAYFDSILKFEQAKASAGLFMSDDRAEAVIEECRAFVAMGDTHYLHATFESRLKELLNSATEVSGDFSPASRDSTPASGDFGGSAERIAHEDYDFLVAENARCIETYVYPAYESLIEGLLNLMGSCENAGGLCHFPNGKSYYEMLVADVTGSDRSILELRTLTLEQIIADIEDMLEVTDSMLAGDGAGGSAGLGTDAGGGVSAGGSFLADSNPTSILAVLRNSLAGNFPAPSDVDISVKFVDASMEEYLSPAFYLIPPIDNCEKNLIYINPKHMTDDLSLFTTLAHEGYPGHLYQTTYFANQEPSPIRSLLGCGGYTEGWATYCEMISYYFAPLDKELAILAQKSASSMLGLYAYADMGIHYDGWSLTETIDFFDDYGISDADAIEEIYNLILGDPANYLQYYIGYLEFLELKKDAIAAWGSDFSQERFHREILEIGPVPFRMLREQML